jgi:hypothetical protein
LLMKTCTSYGNDGRVEGKWNGNLNGTDHTPWRHNIPQRNV